METVEVRDVATGELVASASKHADNVTTVAFSLDGKYLASGSCSMRGTIKLWSITDQKELFTFDGLVADVHQITFSPDSRRFAATSSDRFIRVWDAATGEQIGVFPTDRAEAVTAWLTTDLLITTHSAGFRVWDLSTGMERSYFNTDWNAVAAMSLSPDGKTLATGGENFTTRLWAVREVLPDDQATIQVDLTYNRDLKVVVSGKGRQESFEDSQFHDVKVPAGTYDIKVVHRHTGLLLRRGTMTVQAGERRRLAPFDISRFPTSQPPTPLQTLVGNEAIMQIAFSPDGRALATAIWGGGVALWKWQDSQWTYQTTLRCSCPGRNVVAISPAGTTVATTGEQGVLEIWDFKTRKLLTKLTRPDYLSANRIAYSHDGRFLVSAHESGRVVFWDCSTWQEVGVLRDGDQPLRAISFSPDGQLLATAGDNATVSVWDVTSRERVGLLRGHTNRVDSLVFSPDGTTLASSSQDGTIRLWDVSTGGTNHVLAQSLGSAPWCFALTARH